MMRVLHYIGGLNTGGAETFVMNLYRNINREEIQFDFLVDNEKADFYRNEIEKMGGKIYNIPALSIINIISYMSKVKELIENNNYKIVHCHVRGSASVFFFAIRNLHIVKIMHSHSDSNGRGLRAFIKNTLQLPVKYLVNYRYACSLATGIFMYGKRGILKNFEIIDNGIDTSNFCFSTEHREKIRQQLKLNDNDFVIGNVGRFVEQKNHKFMIKLADILPDYRFVFIGEKKEKNADYIEAQKRENIILVDSTDIVYQYYSAFDIFILPSLNEGLGIVLIEAQYSGLRCLVSPAIHNEAIITENVIKLPLMENMWAEEIRKNKNHAISRYENLKIEKNSYNIKQVAQRMEANYKLYWNDIINGKKI